MQILKWLRLIWVAGRGPLIVAIVLCLLFFIVEIYKIDFAKDNFLYSIPNGSHYFIFISLLSLTSVFIFKLINLFIQEVKKASYQNKNGGSLILVLHVIKKSLKIFTFLILSKLILPLLNIPESYFLIAQKVLYIAIVISISWILIKIIAVWEQVILQKSLYSEQNIESKAVYTKVHILKKIAIFFISVIALAAILVTFEAGKKFGLSIMASAGLVTVFTGLAAQKTLSGLLLGVRMVLTQPIKIGDAIFIENEFGNVEEITLTYVIIKLWDLRRLIVPIDHFMNKPFQNWTKNSRELLGTVMIYVDYHAPIDKLRFQFYELLKQSQFWDGKTAAFHVTECKETCLELRLLMSAQSVSKTWDLRCEMREKFIEYLKNEYPEYLPILRYQKIHQESNQYA